MNKPLLLLLLILAIVAGVSKNLKHTPAVQPITVVEEPELKLVEPEIGWVSVPEKTYTDKAAIRVSKTPVTKD